MQFSRWLGGMRLSGSALTLSPHCGRFQVSGNHQSTLSPAQLRIRSLIKISFALLRLLGFEFRFSGLGVRCGSFCLVCWVVSHFCSNGHVLFCFTFYLTLRSTTCIVHNQLAGLWCWDSPYCSSLFCQQHYFFFHLCFLSKMFSASVISVVLCCCSPFRCVVLACSCVYCLIRCCFSCSILSLFSNASSRILQNGCCCFCILNFCSM